MLPGDDGRGFGRHRELVVRRLRRAMIPLWAAPAVVLACSLDGATGCEGGVGPSCGCTADTLSAAQPISLPDFDFDGVQIRMIGPEDRDLNLTLDGNTWIGTMPPVTPGAYAVVVLGMAGGETTYYGLGEDIQVFACNQWLPQTIYVLPFRTDALNVTAAGDTITTVWAAVPGATFYYVERDTSVAFPAPVVDSVRGTSHDVTVTVTGWHYVRVRAGNAYVANGQASAVDSVLVASPAAAPR